MLLNAKLPFLTRQSLYASPKKYKQSTFYKNTSCFLKWHKCEGFRKGKYLGVLLHASTEE